MFRRGISLVFGLARTHPGPLGIAIFGAAIYALGLVLGSIVLGRVTDEVVIPAVLSGQPDRRTILLGAAAIVGVTVVRSMGVVLRRYFGAMSARRNQATLRRRITDRYLDVPLAYHRSRPTGELLAHADNDVDVATEIINPLPFTTSVIVLAGASVISLLSVDPAMAAIALVLFPTLTVMNQVYSKRVEGPAAQVQARVGRVSAIAHESFDGALIVKTLGLEQRESERFRASSSSLRESRIAVGRLRAVFEPSIDLLPNLGVIGLVLVGTNRLSSGAVTTGDIVQAVVLFGALAFPMRIFGFFLEEIPRSVVAHDRVQTVLATPAGPERFGNETGLPPGSLGLAVDDLVFAYDELAQPNGEEMRIAPTGRGPIVLDGVSFAIDRGETVALVGSTGTGKSTLCQLLVRLADPDSGSVRIGGVDVASIDPTELASRVALVFQEAFLFADSVRANLALGIDAGDAEIEKAAKAASAHDFILELTNGYDTIVGERGVTLSGGQRQRLALARALVRRPDLLILDDATSAVDPVIEAQILDGLRRQSTTMLIVAHRLSTIRLADRVIYLDGGRIVASGSHESLLRLPGYAALARAYEDGSTGPSISEGGAPSQGR